MVVKMPRGLLPRESMSKQEKFQVMQNRRAYLVEIAKNALSGQGYVIGPSLKVPGAHAFEATSKGKPVRIALKTSWDRWVGVAKDKSGHFGALSKVDEVFIVTADNWKEPSRIQIYRFDPALILDKAAKVYEEAERQGQTGLQFIPLDDDFSRRPTTARAAGSLGKHGTTVFDEPVEIVDGATELAADSVSTTEAEVKEEGRSIMERIKAMLSEHMGVRPEMIEIDVRVKI